MMHDIETLKLKYKPLLKKAKELFNYDRVNGELISKVSHAKRKKGFPTGSKSKDGYVTVSINSKNYLRHRIIFLLEQGYIPDILDHINGNRGDDRIENLRPVNISQNSQNKKINSNNNSGYTGVSHNVETNDWSSELKINGKKIFLGRYKTKEDAAVVRTIAELEYFGEYSPLLSRVGDDLILKGVNITEYIKKYLNGNGDAKIKDAATSLKKYFAEKFDLLDSSQRFHNSNNTSGHKGVRYSKIKKRWKSFIGKENKYVHLGHYKNIESAIMVRWIVELELQGKNSKLIMRSEDVPDIDQISISNYVKNYRDNNPNNNDDNLVSSLLNKLKEIADSMNIDYKKYLFKANVISPNSHEEAVSIFNALANAA